MRNAAKARIARMVKEKRKRSDLAVSQFIRDQWSKGTKEKDEMADVLQRMNWDKAS